jgi:1-acyl-sn-glycerol-3-phosphate acyltransferase
LLFAANHASFADPPLVGSSVSRPLYFMAKEELFHVPILGWLIRHVNAFPIRRKEGDVGAFRTAQRILAAGGAMIMFPKDGVRRAGYLENPKRGWASWRSKAARRWFRRMFTTPIRLWRCPRLTVVFGAPLTAMGGETAELFSQRIMDTIRRLEGGPFWIRPLRTVLHTLIFSVLYLLLFRHRSSPLSCVFMDQSLRKNCFRRARFWWRHFSDSSSLRQRF